MNIPGGPATLARRTLSLVYEALLISAVLWFAGLLYAVVETQLALPRVRAAFQLYLVLVAGAYFVPQWVQGQTLPMKTWRIRVVTRYGEVLKVPRAISRYVIALAGLLLFGAGFWWALLDSERLFLHDRLAGTRLVLA